MICKYCGTKIDPTSKVCPKCGKVGNKTEGGNGFWDIARGPAQSNTPAPVEEPKAKSIKEYIPTIICIALSILCLVIAISSLISSSHKVAALKKSFDGQLLEQGREFEQERSALETRLNQLEERVEQFANQPVQEIEVLRILSSPTSETCYVGFQSRPGYYLFGYRVDGSVASFRWEKQQSNGDWEVISFDAFGINRFYGLRIEEDIAQGTSCLVAVGLTPESFGTYKCTAIGRNDTEQSVTVELNNSDDLNPELSAPTSGQPQATPEESDTLDEGAFIGADPSDSDPKNDGWKGNGW